nr:immunoglobulin light chain junction region [Macaca mulatta]MOW04500.1 immunoglobulin light chain junction region [Macaca mulatta]MOW05339.1 immunoglobulin light chain junction region [Macaca mulatta]MOW05385.1 immunoglobulin light chain junction region [Macaca mulatta]MOW07086.1 immunoglobulin light chain junction region [Macaca mulatta]
DYYCWLHYSGNWIF